MAAFLDGLMGALKGVGSTIATDVGKVGSTLLGSLHPAAAGTPAGMSAEPGSGGLMASAQAATAAPKPPGFFQRINTVNPDTGMSTVDKWDRFGAQLGDIYGDGEPTRAAAVDKRVKARLDDVEQKNLAKQIDAMTIDPKLRFLLKSNPKEATKALATHYEAANVGAGDHRVFGEGGTDYMAPKYGEADGYGYKIDPQGFHWGDQRGKTYGEAETGRHNLADEALGNAKVAVDRLNSGISAGHLGVDRQRLDFDRSGGVAGVNARNGDAGSGGLSGLSTADLIAALKGAR